MFTLALSFWSWFGIIVAVLVTIGLIAAAVLAPDGLEMKEVDGTENDEEYVWDDRCSAPPPGTCTHE